MVREVVRALKSILSEQRKQVAEWVDVLPATQWALNTSFRERYQSTPYCVMFGRAPRTSFSALTTVTEGERNVDVMDADSLRAKARQVVDEQERFYRTCRLLWRHLVTLNVKSVSYTHLTLPTTPYV